jgi:hypothetical protein
VSVVIPKAYNINDISLESRCKPFKRTALSTLAYQLHQPTSLPKILQLTFRARGWHSEAVSRTHCPPMPSPQVVETEMGRTFVFVFVFVAFFDFLVGWPRPHELDPAILMENSTVHSWHERSLALLFSQVGQVIFGGVGLL